MRAAKPSLDGALRTGGETEFDGRPGFGRLRETHHFPEGPVLHAPYGYGGIGSIARSVISALLLLLLPAMLRAEVNLPDGNNSEPILITAQAANRWQMDSYEVWILRGDVRFAQGDDVANSQEAVFWIDHAETASRQRTKVIAYLEGDVRLRLLRDGQPIEIRDQKWFGRFYATREVRVQAGVVAGKPNVLPEIYQRGMDQRNPEFADSLRQTHAEPVQFVAPATGPLATGSPAVGPPAAGARPPAAAAAPGTQRIRVFSRGDVPPQAQWKHDPQTNQWILVADQGVTIIIDNFNVSNASIPGVPRGPTRLDISTDRLVLWRTSPRPAGHYRQRAPGRERADGAVPGGQRRLPPGQPPNLCRPHVLRRAEPRRHRAGGRHDHAFAGLRGQNPHPCRRAAGRRAGPLPRPGGLRHAQPPGRAAIRLQATDFTYDEIPSDVRPADRTAPIDPRTGQPEVQKIVAGQNDFVYIENVPVFWWPTFATDLNDPSFFLRGVRFKDDNVFGYQLFFDFSTYQLFGIRQPPKGTDWTFSVDYLSLARFRRGHDLHLQPRRLPRLSRTGFRPVELLGHQRPRPRQPGHRAVERGPGAGRVLSLRAHRPPPPGLEPRAGRRLDDHG